MLPVNVKVSPELREGRGYVATSVSNLHTSHVRRAKDSFALYGHQVDPIVLRRGTWRWWNGAAVHNRGMMKSREKKEGCWPTILWCQRGAGTQIWANGEISAWQQWWDDDTVQLWRDASLLCSLLASVNECIYKILVYIFSLHCIHWIWSSKGTNELSVNVLFQKATRTACMTARNGEWFQSNTIPPLNGLFGSSPVERRGYKFWSTSIYSPFRIPKPANMHCNATKRERRRTCTAAARENLCPSAAE